MSGAFRRRPAGTRLLALWIYCILDVIATDEALVGNMPKVLWLLVVILLPTVGAVAWLALGRPARAGLRPGDTSYRPTRRALAPDDSPEFLSAIKDRAAALRRWEEDLARREEELRRREEGDQGAP